METRKNNIQITLDTEKCFAHISDGGDISIVSQWPKSIDCHKEAENFCKNIELNLKYHIPEVNDDLKKEIIDALMKELKG